MKNLKKLPMLLMIGLAVSNAASKAQALSKTDTIYVGSVLPNASLITNTITKYSLLVRANNTYSSIKLLNREVKLKDKQIFVISKLYNGTYINIDSIITDRYTLMPMESYSNISTSKDSFIYKGNKVSGTLQSKEGDKLGSIKNFDTTFKKPLFNSLMYIETYQALTYHKNQPFYLAEYVPGHGIPKFTRVEYIKDEEIVVSGVKILAKVLETKFGNITALYWLNSKNQEILKVEAKFPRFDYLLVRLV